MTMVLRPPRKISLVYSSMARLESATYGTYLGGGGVCVWGGGGGGGVGREMGEGAGR